MTAYGPKQTFCICGLESAFGCKADIGATHLNVRF